MLYRAYAPLQILPFSPLPDALVMPADAVSMHLSLSAFVLVADVLMYPFHPEISVCTLIPFLIVHPPVSIIDVL